MSQKHKPDPNCKICGGTGYIGQHKTVEVKGHPVEAGEQWCECRFKPSKEELTPLPTV